ncbi:MAG TPA: type II secretion system F family protein [Acetobacteraceae bacterium]|nr:type II secretion system F family protein [Acetobacteraceae bacterium]
MASFRYVAIDPGGRTRRGTMEAATAAEVIAQLQRQGSIPMRAEPAGGAVGRLLQREIGRRGMTRQDVADFTRELAVMLSAGQDLDRALRFLAETAPNRRVLQTVEALRRTVRDGGALAKALAEHPGSFSRLYVGLVRAGEAGGTLAPTLERLATLLERQRSLAATVKSALIYPALLLLAATGSIVLLLTQVLPQFVPLFEQNGAALPGPTRALLVLGDLMSAWGPYGLLALLVMLVAASQVLKQAGPRLAADRALLRLPVLGKLQREIVAARFARTLGSVLINGVPLITALGIVEEVVGNRAAVGAVARAAVLAKGGAGLARPLEESGVFPARMIHLLRLGEETAQLGPMALRAAEIHEERTRLGLQRLVALLVPAITVIMGATIAGIVASLLLAMLGLNDLAGG